MRAEKQEGHEGTCGSKAATPAHILIAGLFRLYGLEEQNISAPGACFFGRFRLQERLDVV